MKAKSTYLALLAALSVGFAAPAMALDNPLQQPYRIAQTTEVEREREFLPDSTPGRSDVEIEQRDGMVTNEMEIDEDGTVDENDREVAGFSIATWIVLGLIALAVAAYFMSRRRGAYGSVRH